jgi:hypothetical protein
VIESKYSFFLRSLSNKKLFKNQKVLHPTLAKIVQKQKLAPTPEKIIQKRKVAPTSDKLCLKPKVAPAPDTTAIVS